MSNKTRRVARILWCVSLLTCPITIEIIAEVYGVRPGTPGLQGEYSPEKVVNAFAISHLVQTAFALIVAYWIWRKYWWFAWLFAIALLILTAIISMFAQMMVTGIWL